MSQVIPLPTLSASPTEAAPASPPAPSASAGSATAPPPAARPPSDQRLVIQESGELGVLVYSIVDRATGEVLAQIPRAEAADMASRKDYTIGQAPGALA